MTISRFTDLVAPKETAEILHVAVDTLAVWRCCKRYKLPFVKIGSKIFYKASDIQKFIDARTVKGGGELCSNQ